ncbi:jg6704 [Pararge aegeria aegeria]|uniref:Jg6704 protein n=1 Tax=Pararge aegeria aegeria TaxID=348720 RepID=A0A8S4SK04_9NEOP|nr:jg6704 [Pararge aegeria aegeria]
MNHSKVIVSFFMLMCIIQSLDCARVKRDTAEEPAPAEPAKGEESGGKDSISTSMINSLTQFFGTFKPKEVPFLNKFPI